MTLPRRYPTLDGLRGVAILLVIAHNLELLEAPQSLLAKLTGAALGHGWIGVQLFFVLSGFLITGQLLDARGSPHYYRDFYVRRILRIFPLYYLTLIGLVWVLPALVAVPDSCRPPSDGGWSYLVYLQNWVQGHLKVMNQCIGPTWSLAVEEQFYFLWPMLLMNRDARATLRLCTWVVSASLAIRAATVLAGVNPEAIYLYSTSRMDALAIGAAIAATLRMPGEGIGWRSRGRTWLISAAAVFAIGWVATFGYPRTGVENQIFGYTLLALAAGLLLAAGVAADAGGHDGWVPRLLRRPVLGMFGTYSYGLYLVHKPVDKLIGRPLLEAWGIDGSRSLAVSVGYTLAGTALSLLLAVLSYHLFERPILGLRNRLGVARADQDPEPARCARRLDSQS